tara:strand:- start:13480 stop:14604 length:1125 start_codon:yes stop_codon:yes gene_type:complete
MTQYLNLDLLQKSLSNKKKVLFLADTFQRAGAIKDHIESINNYSSHKIFTANPRRCFRNPKILFKDFKFDSIIIHYSICILFENFLSNEWKEFLINFRGNKILIIQDEYRWIKQINFMIHKLGIKVIFSSLSQNNAKNVYSKNLDFLDKIVTTLPGYVTDKFISNYKSKVPFSLRPNDIFYRGKNLPITTGIVSKEKSFIGELVKRKTKNLNLDISSRDEDRLYGPNWQLLNKLSKATLATEGGASIYDFDGNLIDKLQDFMNEKKTNRESLFYKKYLAKLEGNIIHRILTPRIFEAISTATVLILFPGKWSNLLMPYKHYIPLERDGSNIKEVQSYLKNNDLLEFISHTCFKEILLNKKNHFKYYVRAIDNCC